MLWRILEIFGVLMGWISCKEKMPIQQPENIPTMDWVLVCSSEYPNPISIARYDGDNWDFIDSNEGWVYGVICGDCTIAFDIKEITHWMPLPKQPLNE